MIAIFNPLSSILNHFDLALHQQNTQQYHHQTEDRVEFQQHKPFLPMRAQRLRPFGDVTGRCGAERGDLGAIFKNLQAYGARTWRRRGKVLSPAGSCRSGRDAAPVAWLRSTKLTTPVTITSAMPVQATPSRASRP